MAEKITPTTAARPTASDLGFEALGAAALAVLLAVALGAGARWIGDMIWGTEGLQDIARLLVGGLLGLVAGAPLGAAIVSARRGRRFSLTLASGGSLLAAALSITLPSAIAGSAGSSAVPWIAAVLCTLGAVVLGNLKTWMGH